MLLPQRDPFRDVRERRFPPPRAKISKFYTIGMYVSKACITMPMQALTISKRRWCRGIMHPRHGCDPGSIPGRRIFQPFRWNVAMSAGLCNSVRGPVALWLECPPFLADRHAQAGDAGSNPARVLLFL